MTTDQPNIPNLTKGAVMIQVQGKNPREVWVACSGGVDSMAAVDFLSNSHSVNVLFFDHGTETSSEAKKFLYEKFGEKLLVGRLTYSKTAGESWEEYWRNQRYACFHSMSVPIITCHHLDDCVETWIWSSLHGTGKIIPYRNRNVYRPFRLNRKCTFTNWARNHSVPWVEDSSNQDIKHMRNFIRKELMEKCLVVNPGLHKVIRKKVLQDEDRTET